MTPHTTDGSDPETAAGASPAATSPAPTDPASTAPEAVVAALLDGVCRLVAGDQGQVERLAGLYAEETLVLHPMAPLGLDPLLTRDQLRRHFADGPGQPSAIRRFEATDVVVHHTTDPEVVVEFAYLVAQGEQEERVPCVFVVRVRDGRIVESHDYIHHLAVARVTGGLPALAAKLAADDLRYSV